MENKDFGHLVSSLRKELRNEFDEPMTQYDLAELARIPLVTLQKIEQGRQANIKPDMLLKLAEVFHLNSRAAQTFFLSSLGSINSQSIRPVVSSQKKLAELTQVLSRMQTPAYIVDNFGDIVVLNQSGMAIFNMEISQMHAPHLLTQYNFNRFMFSQEFNDLQKLIDNSSPEYLHRTVLQYKWSTMTIRNHWYFKLLLPELNRYPLFREQWQMQPFHDEDIYVQYKTFMLNNPRLGQLHFLSSPNQMLTSDGDLVLFIMQPLDAHSAEVCLQLARDLGTQPIHLASWPKPATPAG